jgi:hypothetical protein
MPDRPLDNRTLLRKTLITAGVMVSAGAVVVGTLTFVASAVTSRAVAGPGASDDAGAPASPSIARHPGPGGKADTSGK